MQFFLRRVPLSFSAPISMPPSFSHAFAPSVRAGRIPTRMLALDRYEYCTRMHACSRPRRWAGGDRLVLQMYVSCYKVAAPRPLPLEIDRALTAPPLHDSSSCKRSLGPRRAQDSAEVAVCAEVASWRVRGASHVDRGAGGRTHCSPMRSAPAPPAGQHTVAACASAFPD